MSVTIYYFLSQILKIPHSTWILIWMSDFFFTFVFTRNFCSALVFLEYVSCKLQVTNFWFGFLFSPDFFRGEFSLLTFNTDLIFPLSSSLLIILVSSVLLLIVVIK